MKRILTSILVAAGIAGPFVGRVSAQAGPMIADIPFTFVANQTTMAAGRYELTQSTADGSAFLLRNASGGAIFVTLGTRTEGNPDRPNVTFACYRQECVLAKIAPTGSLTAHSLALNSVKKHLHQSVGMAAMVSIKLAAR